MDAKEFFSVVVVENYKEAIADPANFRKLWNAALSMNTVAEYLALMELLENVEHQRSLVHSRSGTNLVIRGFKLHHADQSQNPDLSRDHAHHPH
jgi:hypothetical protein